MARISSIFLLRLFCGWRFLRGEGKITSGAGLRARPAYGQEREDFMKIRMLQFRRAGPFALAAAALAALTATPGAYAEAVDKETCSLNGIKLHGKVQVVESFPDLKVQVVSSFPDLKVKEVTSFPDDCGEWQFVDSFPDFKIQYVDSFPDLKIQKVESFPGVP
jgi:hypothetical protein